MPFALRARAAWLLGLAMAFGSAEAQPVELTPDVLWDLVRIGTPVVSPNGRWVVFTATRHASAGKGPSIDLWLVDSGGREAPRQLTRNPGPDFDPAWSADSRRIVYASGRDGGVPQLYLLSLRGGEPQPLTTFPTGATRPRFRDEDRLIFEALTYPDIGDNFERLMIRTSRSRRDDRLLFSSEARVIRRGEVTVPDRAVLHLFELDLKSERIRDLMTDFDHSIAVTDLDWDLSPGGRYLAVSANVTKPPYRSLDRDLFLLDLGEGDQLPATENLSDGNPGDDFGPRFSPTGDTIVYGRRNTTDSLAEFTQLVSLGLRNRELRVISDADRLSPERWIIGSAGQQVHFLAEERGRRNLYRVDVRGGKGLSGPGDDYFLGTGASVRFGAGGLLRRE